MNGISNFRRGDTKVIKLKLKDNQGNPINLTGAKIWFTMKQNLMQDDSEAAVQKEITNHTNAAQGESQIVLTHDDTNNLSGTYYYDIQLVDANNNVTTLIFGKLNVLPDVTRSV